jgi:hypothetical protein
VQFRKRFRNVLVSPENLPSEDDFVAIFFAARLIAMRIEQRPDYDKIMNKEKHAKFYARSFKDQCFSLINSFIRRAPLDQLARSAATLFPRLTGAGFDAISEALVKEFSQLLDLIVFEKTEFFWFYNKFFQRGIDSWK